jgi:hypothetical protein
VQSGVQLKEIKSLKADGGLKSKIFMIKVQGSIRTKIDQSKG